ncbi:SOS response-associated peptidase family protein [Bifidobacterium sp. ESL0790]|uniref:SOS response-associated peptidase n=1 Tax=Bifidobacterium sp. ESL0790 TaxID=2983233 RepID=UPI0023F98B1A|nr:SOS response-associated peptidase family protein [Bifidobacterium sp. ESL0790]WEV71778.1 SOS response-associated peptidase family protein [Bifidobacterium sp. ESL0790]
MCRVFSMDLDWDAIGHDFGVDDDQISHETLPMRTFAVKPKQTIALVAQGKNGVRHLRGANWSLIPRSSPNEALPFQTYNARVESAQYRPFYCDSMHCMRAIIPASGYFEYKSHRPHYFHAPDDSPLSLAGLYSWWRPNPATPWKLTATVITCAATEEFWEIHKRMPLLIPRDKTDLWLDPATDGASIIRGMRDAGYAVSEKLIYHEVSKIEGDGPQIIQPLSHETPLSLF